MRPGSLSLRHVPRSRRILLSAIAVAVTALLAWVVTGPMHLARADEAPLSQGRAVTASSIEGAAFPAAAAVDGNATSRWSSAFSDPQWLQVDLAAPAAIDRVVLQWEAAYARAFQIQTSADAATWTTMYTRRREPVARKPSPSAAAAATCGCTAGPGPPATATRCGSSRSSARLGTPAGRPTDPATSWPTRR